MHDQFLECLLKHYRGDTRTGSSIMFKTIRIVKKESMMLRQMPSSIIIEAIYHCFIT
jgi:hypothetical protein